MPRRINKVNRVPTRVTVQMLCPRTVRIAVIRILRSERPDYRIVVPRIHVRQSSRAVTDRSRIGDLIGQKTCLADRLAVAELVVRVTLL